jgi:hypothetical protein
MGEAEEPAVEKGADANLEGWTTRQAILTPGDRVEYKIKLTKGQVLLASATSNAFDPALAIDFNKRELIKNDDRIEGDQRPFLNFRAPQDGDYLLKVISYRSVAGGQFNVHFRVITPIDVEPNNPMKSEPQSDDYSARTFVRVPLKAGLVYDPTPWGPQRITNFERVIGPTGVPSADFERVAFEGRATPFIALRSGDFLIEYRGKPRGAVIEVREVPRLAATPDATVEIAKSVSLALVEVPVEPGSLFSSTVEGLGMALASFGGRAEGYARVGASTGWAWFHLAAEEGRQVVRSFTAKGVLRLLVRRIETENALRLVTSSNLPKWDPGAPISRKLEIGTAQVFVYEAQKAELARVALQTEGFWPIFTIYTLAGAPANRYANRATSVRDDLWFPEAGRFLVRIGCQGDGGSGPFSLRREAIEAKPLMLGQVGSVTDASALTVYGIDLQAGKTYSLVCPQGVVTLRDLVDPTGTFLGRQEVLLDNMIVSYFTARVNGRHRLWFRRVQGKFDFVLRLAEAPVIGGNR